MRLVAELLIGVERCLKLAERPNSIISLQEIEEAGTRWASRKAGPPTRLRPELSRQRFIREAVRWLAFMERLQPPSRSTKPYENRIVEFADFMLHERGLSVATIEQRCHTVRQFLDQLCERERALQDVTVSEVDSILAARVNQGHYARASVQTCASSLRSFFPLRRSPEMVQGRYCGIHHVASCLPAGVLAVDSNMVRGPEASRQHGWRHSLRDSRPVDLDGACHLRSAGWRSGPATTWGHRLR